MVQEREPVESLTRRERLKQEREERILDAAATVFASKGFHRATIREIAEFADVADGTIYNYFENKYDLLIGIMTRLTDLEQLPAELTLTLQSDARESLAKMLQHRLARIEHSQEMLQAILPEVMVNPELRRRYYQQFVRRIVVLLEQYVQTRIELGHLREMNVPLTVRILQSVFIGLVLLRIVGDETLQSDWEEVPEVLASLLFDGLLPAGQE